MKLILKILCTILSVFLCLGLILTFKCDNMQDLLICLVKFTLLMINVWALCEIWGFKLLCNIFGHAVNPNPSNGIIYCKRCKYPMYRINKNN